MPRAALHSPLPSPSGMQGCHHPTECCHHPTECRNSVDGTRPQQEERLVFSCRTTSASTAPRTPRRTCCPYAYVLISVLCVSRSCELFSGGFNVHLLHSRRYIWAAGARGSGRTLRAASHYPSPRIRTGREAPTLSKSFRYFSAPNRESLE